MHSEQSPKDLTISERLVRLHDHTTMVRESAGTEPPVVLIHALSMDCHFWADGVFELLASSQRQNGTTRRVIAYDLRGHGKAQNAPITTSVEQLAADLRELCSIENLEKIDVIGISYGGAIAQHFVLFYPDLVRSAVFMATTSRGVPAFADRATIAETKGLEVLFEPTIERWFLSENVQANADCVRYARKMLASTRVENWAAAWRALSQVDYMEQLQSIKVPVLCLAGRQDTSTPPELLKRISSACVTSVYREIARGMHFFALENPQATAAELITFLDKVDNN